MNQKIFKHIALALVIISIIIGKKYSISMEGEKNLDIFKELPREMQEEVTDYLRLSMNFCLRYTFDNTDVTRLTFSNTGKFIAYGHEEATLIDTKTGNLIRQFDSDDGFAFSPDDMHIYIGDTNYDELYDNHYAYITRYETISGEEINTIDYSDSHINNNEKMSYLDDIAISKDERFFALLGSTDDSRTCLYILNNRTDIIYNMVTNNIILNPTFTPDSKKLIFTKNGTCSIYNIESNTSETIELNTDTFALSSDGKYILTPQQLWNANTLQLIHDIPNDNSGLNVAFSHNNKYALIGPSLLDVKNNKFLLKFDTQDIGAQVAFSPDGEHALIGNHVLNMACINELATNLAHLNIAQAELIQAYNIAKKNNQKIYANLAQWDTFKTLEPSTQDVLKDHITQGRFTPEEKAILAKRRKPTDQNADAALQLLQNLSDEDANKTLQSLKRKRALSISGTASSKATKQQVTDSAPTTQQRRPQEPTDEDTDFQLLQESEKQ